MKLVADIFDFFLPRFCAACKTKLNEKENIVCPLCQSKIKLAEKERIKSEFERKFLNKKIISDFTSLYVFEKDKELQYIIHELKYNKKFLIGIFLGKLLAKSIKEKIINWNINLIIPVPLHHLKKAERGFNQSFYISKGLSKQLKIPIGNKIVKRKRFTQSQTTMTLKEREENISGAFSLRKNKNLFGRNILLVDDVITTGATVSECGRVLLKAGAAKIYAASVAVAD